MLQTPASVVTGLALADTLWALGRATYLLRCLLRLGVRADDPKWFMFDLLWGDLREILTGRAWTISRTGKQL